MAHKHSTVTKLVIGAVAVGAVWLGTAGVAGAAPTSSTAKGVHHFNCVKAPKALARLEAAEARIATGLPRLNAAETKAEQNGNTKRADRIKRRIARLESTATKARLDKRIANIEAKCHVSAPSGSSSTAPQSNAGNPADTAAATA